MSSFLPSIDPMQPGQRADSGPERRDCAESAPGPAPSSAPGPAVDGAALGSTSASLERRVAEAAPGGGPSARELAVIDEVAAAVCANPTKAGDLIAIALSHHPHLAHRLVLETIKRCPTAASRVLSAARLSRSIGARLVFSALLALAINKVFGQEILAQAAEPATPEAEPNAQHAQVAAFLAGLNAALALMPNKEALAAESGDPAPFDDDAEGDGAEPLPGVAAADVAAVEPSIAPVDLDPLDAHAIAAEAEAAAGAAGTAPPDLSELAGDPILPEAVALPEGGQVTPSPAQLAEGAAPPAQGALAFADSGAEPGRESGDEAGEAIAEAPITEIRDEPNANGYLVGGDGQDWLYGGDGHDVLVGWGDNDRLFGGTGRDFLLGHDGDDEIYGEQGTDYAWGGNGDDLIDGGGQRDVLFGGAGNDSLIGGDGADYLGGDEGDDRLSGGRGGDRLHGGDGNDWIDAGQGADWLYGGAGDDLLIGGAGSDSIDGGAGQDTVSYQGADAAVEADLASGQAHSGADSDHLRQIEKLIGSDFDDSLAGDEGANLLAGGAGDDWLEGAGGDDSLVGGEGNDILSGGAGEDWLAGGAGEDRLSGGAGDDGYRISAQDGGIDVIADSEGSNLLVLDGFGPGALVWAELRENGDLDILVRGADGLDRAVVRVEGYAAAPEAFTGVAINDRMVDSETLLARLEIEPPAPEAPAQPEVAEATDDILGAAAAEDGVQGDVPPDDILSLDESIGRLPGVEGDSLVLPADGGVGAGLEVVLDELGQNVIRLLGHAPDAAVWGQVGEGGDLAVMVRDAAGEDSLVATIEAYADHPESLAAIEINGRSVALPDLVQGADLVPRSDAPEDPAPLGPPQDDGSLVLEVEQAEGGAVDSIVIPPADQAALAALGQTAEDDSQSDGL